MALSGEFKEFWRAAKQCNSKANGLISYDRASS